MNFSEGYEAIREYAVSAAKTAWGSSLKTYIGPQRQEPTEYPHIAVWRSDSVAIENETPRTDAATITLDVVTRFAITSGMDIDQEVVRLWEAIRPQINASAHPGTFAGETVGQIPQIVALIETLGVPDPDRMEVGIRWRVDFSFARA